MMEHLNDGDIITMTLFGKEEEMEVFSTGDNRYVVMIVMRPLETNRSQKMIWNRKSVFLR